MHSSVWQCVTVEPCDCWQDGAFRACEHWLGLCAGTYSLTLSILPIYHTLQFCVYNLLSCIYHSDGWTLTWSGWMLHAAVSHHGTNMYLYCCGYLALHFAGFCMRHIITLDWNYSECLYKTPTFYSTEAWNQASAPAAVQIPN